MDSANAGLSAVSDGELTGYADNQSAALLTHDVEFSKRRVDELAAALTIQKDVWVRLSCDGLTMSFAWK